MKLVTYRDGRGGVVIDDHVVSLGDLDGVPGDVTAVLAAGPDIAITSGRRFTAAIGIIAPAHELLHRDRDFDPFESELGMRVVRG